MRKLMLAAVAALGVGAAFALDMREIAFFTATPVKEAPKIDGVLDEAFWKEITPNTNYYQYVHIEPNNPQLVDCPTELRIAYDDKGIYVGVRNWEDLPAKMARSATKNYDGAVYWNDCAELFFDPDASGVGYYKFTVNPNGVFDVIWRMDAANQHYAYRLPGVTAAAKVFDDRWEIELFVPWSALHGRSAAKPGDVWTANHCRFRFTHDCFFCTASPGGSGYTPQKFGYLYFTDGTAPSPEKVISIVEERVTDNWGIQVAGKTYLHDADGTRPIDKTLIEVVKDVKAQEKAVEELAITNIARLAENPYGPHAPLALPYAGKYDFDEPSEYNGYSGWYRHNRPKNSVRTPHLDWFGGAAKNPKVFFLTGSNGTWREMVEVADRFGCEAFYQPCFFGASGTYEDAVTLGKPMDKYRQFESILAKNPDVLVMHFPSWTTSFDKVPARYRYEILRRVADEGMGLVLLDGMPGELRKFVNKFAKPGEKNPNEVTVGRGRIVAANFGRAGLWTPAWRAEFETRMAKMWNLIRGAQANREILATVDFPDGDAKIEVGPQSKFVACRVTSRGADEAKVRLRNEFNDVISEKAYDLKKGANTLSVDVEKLPHGRYFIDVIPLDGDEGDTVASRAFEKTGPLGALTIDGTNVSVVAEGQSRGLACSFVRNVPEGTVFEWKLRDLPYRQVRAEGREVVKGVRGISVSAPKHFPTLAALLEVKATLADGTCVADARKMVFFPNHRFEDYTLISWDGCEDWGLGELEAPQLIEEIGYRNNLGGSKWSSAVWNARVVAQHAHVRIFTNKSGGTHWRTFRGFCTPWTEKDIDKLGDEITPNDPEVQRILEKYYSEYVKDAVRFAPCAWNLGDECSFIYGIGRGPKDRPAYLEFLKRKYGTVAKYNEVHATNITDFAQAAHPKMPEAFKAGDWAGWCDTREFSEYTYAQAYQLFHRIVKKVDPKARVGAEGSNPGDLELTVKDLEYWGPYRSLVDDELLRCIAPNTLRGIWWGGYFNNKRDGYPLQMWEFVLTGTLNADMFFAAAPGGTQGMMGGDFTIAPYVQRMLPYLKPLRRGLAQQMQHTPFRNDGFAIYFSHPSAAISKNEDRFTAPSASQGSLIGFCYRKGYGVNMVTPRRLAELKKYKVVFLCGLNTVSDAEAAAFRDFAKQGGILVADTDVGVLDGFQVPRKENPLKDLFGNVLLKDLGDAEKRKVTSDKPQLVAYGKGGAVKLGYTLAAAQLELGKPALDALLQGLLDLRGIRPTESCTGLGEGGIFRVRQRDDLVLAGFKTITKYLGSAVTVDFGRDGWVYECGKGLVGKLSKVELEKLDCPFKLYAQFTTEQSAPEVKLSHETLAPGQSLMLDTTLLRKESVYRFEVIAPNGKAIACREEVFAADGKPRSYQVPFDDALGEYTLQLTDIATGLVGSKTLTVAKKRPVPRKEMLARFADEFEIDGLIHWGPNTVTDREWGYGDEDPAAFNPVNFDADAIVEQCKQAGMRGLTLVAKHHDGYCLWPTKTTDHNISKSPWRGGKGDVVREFADACKRGGIGFGVYVSPWDRNNAHYGTDKYPAIYHEQWREVASGAYGKLYQGWFDGANGGDGYYGGARAMRKIENGYDYYDIRGLAEKLKAWNPGFVFMGGGDGVCDLRWPCNEEGYCDPDARAGFTAVGDPGTPGWGHYAKGDINGSLFVQPCCDFPQNPGWFYHEDYASATRPPLYLMQLYLRSVGHGGVMEIGVSPRKDGTLSPVDAANLKEFGEIRAKFFSDKVAEGTFDAGGDEAEIAGKGGFNVIVLREDLSKGEQIDGWELWLDRKDGTSVRLASGVSVGVKRIRTLPRAVDGEKLRFVVTASAGDPRDVQFRLYNADQSLVDRVWSAKKPELPRYQQAKQTSAKGLTLAWDFGKPVTFSRFSLDPQTGAGAAQAPASGKVSFSLDGQTWFGEMTVRLDNVAANPVSQQFVTAKPVEARYAKLVADRTISGKGDVALRGFGARPVK